MHFVIDGVPRTKKNSLRVLTNRRTGKPFVAQSAQHNDWATRAVWQLRNQWRAPALSGSVAIAATVYRDRAVGDLLNFLAAISDALEHAGVVVNDRQIVSWDGSRMTKDTKRPRVELLLSEVAQ